MVEIKKKLLDDVMSIAQAAAQQYQYIDNTIPAVLNDIAGIATGRTRFSETDLSDRAELVNKGFENITNEILKLSSEQVNHLSRLVAIGAIVTNATENAQNMAVYTDPKNQPKQQIKSYLSNVLNKADNKEVALSAIKSKMDSLLISLVDTKHPTIYHTPEASNFEARLSSILENPENLLAYVGLDGPLGLNDRGKKAVEELFASEPDSRELASGFIQGLASEKITISPKRPMTVAIETKAQVSYINKMRQEVHNVVQAWNAALDEIAIEGLSLDKLHISADREKEMIEFRTWGLSADADGRDKSTSSFLYENIRNGLEGKEYTGVTLDLRQNAKKVHLPFISSLIQIKQRNSEDTTRGREARYESQQQRQLENDGVAFADYCREFMNAPVGGYTTREEKYEAKKINDNGNGNGLSWQGPEYSIFQQLDGDDRVAFLTSIMEKNYKLLPKQLEVDTLEYNQAVYAAKAPFLKKYEKQIRDAGYDPETIDYNEMQKVTVLYDLKNPDGPKVSLRPLWDQAVQRLGFEILHNGLQYSRLLSDPSPNQDQLLVKNFLQGTKKVGANELEDLSEKDRATFTDTAKRLFIINHAIDEYGPKVATRYQIANFSEAADFLILLKLFQDTGIAKIEDGKVLGGDDRPKLAIQPLLETGEDLKNAPAVFEKLLNNPLTKSFWQARATKDAPGGEAEIMLGFSDGAASVGNFASQWEIYKATENLTALFAGHGIKVRFFQGRGRGTDRGGSIDPRLQMDLVSPEAMQRGIYDVTLQSDLPMDLAASQAYGEDYFTKMLLGTLDASLKAPKRIEAKESLLQVESDIQWIADRSAEIYQTIVRTDNPEAALKLINNMPDNPNKTSRAAKRGEDKISKIFDDVRAIPKEYLLNGMDLQAHNVGIKQALKEFEKDHGSERLGALNQHPFFGAITQTIRAGMSNYDPVVAKAYAKALKLPAYKLPGEDENAPPKNFVEYVMPHLDGLAGYFDYITGNARPNKKDKGDITFHRPSWGSVLDQIAHGIIVTGLEKGNPASPVVGRPDQKEWVDTLFNSLFVTSQEVGHRILPWRTKEATQSIAA